MAKTFAEKLVCQFLCSKQKLSITCYLFVYMTRHIFVPCIYLHVGQALCDYNIALKTNFWRIESKNICCNIYTRAIVFVIENCQTKVARVNGA